MPGRRYTEFSAVNRYALRAWNGDSDAHPSTAPAGSTATVTGCRGPCRANHAARPAIGSGSSWYVAVECRT